MALLSDVDVQALIRRLQARQERRRLRAYHRARRQASRRIQGAARGRATRAWLARQALAALNLQRLWRGHLGRLRAAAAQAELEAWAIGVIQRRGGELARRLRGQRLRRQRLERRKADALERARVAAERRAELEALAMAEAEAERRGAALGGAAGAAWQEAELPVMGAARGTKARQPAAATVSDAARGRAMLAALPGLGRGLAIGALAAFTADAATSESKERLGLAHRDAAVVHTKLAVAQHHRLPKRLGAHVSVNTDHDSGSAEHGRTRTVA
jgi:hypothetical protein